MSEFLALALAALAGTFLGALFFGGLWWTLRRALMSARPALWISGSALLRLGIALSGFYVVADGHWERLLACLVGFIGARQLVTLVTRASRGGRSSARQEAGHAP